MEEENPAHDDGVLLRCDEFTPPPSCRSIRSINGNQQQIEEQIETEMKNKKINNNNNNNNNRKVR
jgi:hypothetical protein